MKAKWGWLENAILKWQLPIVLRCHVSQSGTDIAREAAPLPCGSNLITTMQGGTDSEYVAKININSKANNSENC